MVVLGVVVVVVVVVIVAVAAVQLYRLLHVSFCVFQMPLHNA
jgi:hypothetical protein